MTAAVGVSLDEVEAEASRIGFVACGVAALHPSERGDKLDAWLAAGYGGNMRYIHRQATRRKDPSQIVAGATCAVVVLENYAAPENDRRTAGDRFKVAAYARGADYHVVTQRRLESLAAWLRERGATIAHPWVDAGPVPERELAERAGLGWIGKNSMLVNPKVGSYTFIGTVFTDLKITNAHAPAFQRCGTCTRCLDACPTNAFVAPRVLDATRCISYLTIEHKPDPSPELVPLMNGWAMGCDICNDVCPWNVKFAQPTSVAEFACREHPDRQDAAAFDDLDDDTFAARYGDTPFMRPGRERMRRNVRNAVTGDR